MSETVVDNTAGIVIIGENDNPCSYMFSCTSCHGYTDTVNYFLNNPRHNGGSNFGFVDGHAKWVQARASLNPDMWQKHR
jgi:prepilin-type processing-associated H-X9-DG protein